MTQLSLSLNQKVTIVYYYTGNISGLKNGIVKKITPKKQDITIELTSGGEVKFDLRGYSKLVGNSQACILDVNDEDKVKAVNEFKDLSIRKNLIKKITENLPNLKTEELKDILNKI